MGKKAFRVLATLAASLALAVLGSCSFPTLTTLWVLDDGGSDVKVTFANEPEYAYDFPGGAPSEGKGKGTTYTVEADQCRAFDIRQAGDIKVQVERDGVAETITIPEGSGTGSVVVIDPSASRYLYLQDISSFYNDKGADEIYAVDTPIAPAKLHVVETNPARTYVWTKPAPSSITVFEGQKVTARKLFWIDAEIVEGTLHDDLVKMMTDATDEIDGIGSQDS